MRLNSIAIKISRKGDLESITESFNHILQNPLFQTDDNLREFRKYLEDNYQNRIFITDIFIPKNFKEKIGVYPFEFLQIYRISKAIEMMKTQDMNISEIVSAVGYQYSIGLRRNLKRFAGMTSTSIKLKENLIPPKPEKPKNIDLR